MAPKDLSHCVCCAVPKNKILLSRSHPNEKSTKNFSNACCTLPAIENSEYMTEIPGEDCAGFAVHPVEETYIPNKKRTSAIPTIPYELSSQD